MRSAFQAIKRDLKNRENLDLYVTVIVSLLFAVLSLLWPTTLGFERLIALNLTVLAILSIGLLLNRHKMDQIGSMIIHRYSREGFFQQGWPSQQLEQDLANAEQIYLVGIVLFQRLVAYRDAVVGKHLRVLMMNPTTDLCEFEHRRRSLAFADPQKTQTGITDNLEKIHQWIVESPEPNLIEVRLLDYVPHIGGAILDPSSRNGKMFIQMYPYKMGEAIPKYVLTKSDGYGYAVHLEMFERMWESATISTPNATKNKIQ